jgi:hypothetical protein
MIFMSQVSPPRISRHWQRCAANQHVGDARHPARKRAQIFAIRSSISAPVSVRLMRSTVGR